MIVKIKTALVAVVMEKMTIKKMKTKVTQIPLQKALVKKK
jgi:hypothetical protein